MGLILVFIGVLCVAKVAGCAAAIASGEARGPEAAAAFAWILVGAPVAWFLIVMGSELSSAFDVLGLLSTFTQR